MHRVPLTEVVLQIKKLGVGDDKKNDGAAAFGAGDAAAFLAQALEPPAPAAVASAVATLREIGALSSRSSVVDQNGEEGIDGGGSLTPLGHHLASLPVDCRVAKMLVYGALLSCV